MGPKKYDKDGGTVKNASSTPESKLMSMFGKEKIDFNNIPTPSTQREITGDTPDEIISEVLNQLDLGWQLSVKNAEELNEVLAQKFEKPMKGRYEHLCKFWDSLLKNFTFDDFKEESYEKLASYVYSKDENDDNLGPVDTALFDIARMERYLFEHPACKDRDSHAVWRNLYHTLLDACIRSIRKAYSTNPPQVVKDDESTDTEKPVLHAPFICHDGECKFLVKMITPNQEEKTSSEAEMPLPASPSTSATSTEAEKEEVTTVQAVPDLVIYSVWEMSRKVFPELYFATMPILVIEVRKSNKGRSGDPIEYDANTSESCRENLTDTNASESSLTLPSGDAGQVNYSRKRSAPSSADKSQEFIKKRRMKVSDSGSISRKGHSQYNRLGSCKTQHFFELVGALKDTEDKTVENRKNHPVKPTKMLGCYIIKNKIHLTALKVTTIGKDPTTPGEIEDVKKAIRYFIDTKTTKAYAQTDKRVQFRYSCTDSLDLFNLKHFTALMKWFYYILLNENNDE